MQLFNFRGHHFSPPFRGLYLPNAWSQTLQTSKRQTFRVSAFPRYHMFGVKLFPVGCAQDHKTRKMLFLDLAPPTLENSGIFHVSTSPHLHFDGVSPKSRRSVVSKQDLECVTSIRKKHSRFVLAWSRPLADRGLLCQSIGGNKTHKHTNMPRGLHSVSHSAGKTAN